MNKTALIVVDMIYDFTNPSGKIYYPGNEHVLPNIIDLIHVCKKHDCRVFFVKHSLTEEDVLVSPKKTRTCCIKGTGGDELDKRLPVDSNDIIISKTKYSAFFKTPLKEKLDQLNIEQLIVVGTKTNNCVYATVLDGYNYNYPVYVVKECVGTKDDETNALFLRDIDNYLGKVITYDEALELLKSGDL